MTTKEAMLTVLPLHEKFPSCNDPLFWLTLSATHDFCHVDRATVEFRVRNDGTSFTSKVDHSEVIRKERADLLAYFLPPGRPLIAERQRQALENIGRNGTIPFSLMQLNPPLEIVEE